MQTDNQEINLIITNSIKQDLKTISFWSKFLSILGFVVLGFMLIAAIFMIIAGLFIDKMTNEAAPFSFALSGLVYIVMGVIYFFPTYYLFKSGNKLSAAVNNNNQDELTEGFKHTKSLYKFIGVSTIAIIVLYILIAIVSVLFTIIKSGF